jgi:hypothetical protein
LQLDSNIETLDLKINLQFIKLAVTVNRAFLTRFLNLSNYWSAKMTENHNLEKAVNFLAQNNFEVEDGLERIIWLRHNAGDTIRLIEVNRNGFPAGRVEAFYFAPSEDVPFETYLADITHNADRAATKQV